MTPDFTVDLAAKRVMTRRRRIRLTPTEWEIVEILVRNPGRLVTQRQLLQEVWGPQYSTETNYLRVYMAQIRRKLEPDPSRPRYFIPRPDGLPVRAAGGVTRRETRLTGRVSDGAEGARTPDLLAASQTLSQLSYGPKRRDCRCSNAKSSARGQQIRRKQQPRASARRSRDPRAGRTPASRR